VNLGEYSLSLFENDLRCSLHKFRVSRKLIFTVSMDFDLHSEILHCNRKNNLCLL